MHAENWLPSLLLSLLIVACAPSGVPLVMETSTPQPETLSGILKNIGVWLAGLLLGFIAGGVSFWPFSSYIRNRRTQG